MGLYNDLNFEKIKGNIRDYIFVFDIDNTLISDAGDVDEDFFEIAKAMIERKIKFTFATGRSYEFSKEVINRVETKLPVICFDGQVLCTSKTVLYKNAFSEISTVYLEKLEKDFYIYVEDTFEIVTTEERGALLYSLEFNYPRKHIRVESRIQSHNPMRIYLRKKKKDIEFDEQKIRELICFNNFNVKVYPEEIWMMIYPENIDKMDACLELCKLQELDISHIVFFGDDYNDIRLMQECGFSIAMGDAICEIIEIADIKIGTVKEKGVSSFLRQILELN